MGTELSRSRAGLGEWALLSALGSPGEAKLPCQPLHHSLGSFQVGVWGMFPLSTPFS